MIVLKINFSFFINNICYFFENVFSTQIQKKTFLTNDLLRNIKKFKKSKISNRCGRWRYVPFAAQQLIFERS